jgi:hypothetical protein
LCKGGHRRGAAGGASDHGLNHKLKKRLVQDTTINDNPMLFQRNFAGQLFETDRASGPASFIAG